MFPTDLVSKPSARPQPELAQYGVGELALFKVFTRESYRSTFGVQAPAYEPSQRIKAWFDSSVDLSDPESLVVYRVIAQDRSGAPVLRQVGMPAGEAARVNLPGAVEYPVYSVSPTHATRGGSPLNPEYLSLCTDADALASVLGAEGVIDEGATTVYPAEYPSDELRRMWAIPLRSQSYNVGILLKSRNASGVGAPGDWSVATGEPVWVPAAPLVSSGAVSAQSPWETPCRDLFANEKLQLGIFGPAVVRTDKQAEADLNSGRFLQSDRLLLQEIWQALQVR
ncbi:MAG: hypothetical protein ABI823_01730 [Bryobacteraceae bacterium]